MDHNFTSKKSSDEFGWHERGYLPHFDAGELPQFITFRLADSMPAEVLEEWRDKAATDADFRKAVESYLDAGHGACWLKDAHIAAIVRDALRFHHGSKYRLISYVLMPNHVHVLLTPLEKVHLPEIMHSIKSFTAKEANKILQRSGHFWQKESFDRYIRNLEHFAAVIKYIENNPVKAGLCRSPQDWPFSSAHR
ncbi:MAG: transposase [Acidobacteriota bacterium]